MIINLCEAKYGKIKIWIYIMLDLGVPELVNSNLYRFNLGVVPHFLLYMQFYIQRHARQIR